MLVLADLDLNSFHFFRFFFYAVVVFQVMPCSASPVLKSLIRFFDV